MPRVLVVYGTRSGCTETIAVTIADTLRALSDEVVETGGEPIEVDLADAESAPSPGIYAAVVVGSGVRGGQWHAAAEEWVVEHAEMLRETPVAFFTVGLTLAKDPARADEVRHYTDALLEETGVRPLDVGVFAGWYYPHRLKLAETLVLRAMNASEGDFRDLDAVARWTRDVLPRLIPLPRTAA